MKRRTEVVDAFDSRLRAALRKRMPFCESCGRSLVSVRTIATAAGVSHASLWRFVQGSPPSNELADALVDYLGVKPTALDAAEREGG